MADSAHHLDLRLPNILDPPSVVEGRNMERYYLAKWMQEKNQSITEG